MNLTSIIATADLLEKFYIIHDIPLNYSYNMIRGVVRSYENIASLDVEQKLLFDVFSFALQKYPMIDIFPILYVFQFIDKDTLVRFMRFVHVKLSKVTGTRFPPYYVMRNASIPEIYSEISKILRSSDENFYSFLILFRAYFISSRAIGHHSSTSHASSSHHRHKHAAHKQSQLTSVKAF